MACHSRCEAAQEAGSAGREEQPARGADQLQPKPYWHALAKNSFSLAVKK